VNFPIRPTDRASLISEILDQREPMQKRIDQTHTNLKELQSALAQAETQRGHLLAQVELDDVKDGLQGIDFRRTWATIEHELKALEKLRQRFGRGTLNIGVIGRARQGKSRLLQSLTGLTAKEIPDGDGDHCTGVKSNIIRRAGETTAKVIFHDEQSFLEKISVYYKALDLGTCPSTIENFASLPLAPRPSSKTTEADKEKYGHLEKYKDNVATYRTLIGQEQKPIKADEIRQYVAQDTVDGKRIYSNYLAVKEVFIYCDFPNPDVGQISVIDMPGLGDTGIGDKERMIETLGESVDFVLFVKKPGDASWNESDVDLYDTARKALIDLPIKQWSFMVLNRTEGSDMGNNYRYCETLHEKIERKNIVSQTIVANCSKSDEVNNLILDSLLNYMLGNIERLDQQYAQTCQQRVNTICAEVEAIVTTANMVMSLLPSDDDGGKLFNARFNEFWPSLASRLRSMLKQLSHKREKQDPNFKDVIEKILTDCRNNPNLPSPQDIEEVQMELKHWPGTQGKLMHQIRNQLSKAFSGVEVGLKPCINEIKQQIYQVLQQENLDGLAPGYENAEYLQQVASNIPKDCPELKLAFEQLSSFELLYRGFVQHRIRKHLDVLTPDLTPYHYGSEPRGWKNFQSRKEMLIGVVSLVIRGNPENKNGLALGKGFKTIGSDTRIIDDTTLIGAEQVTRNLTDAYHEALDCCDQELKALLDEPSLAAFAIAEEFVDRILLAKDSRNEFWNFLWQYRKDIWPETFSQNEQLRGVALNWKNAVNALEPFRSKTRYQFS
jgi:hypothetical protein